MYDALERGRAILKQQPFSVLMGTELVALRKGYAEMALELREELNQQHGFAHGGVVSYLADNALAYAGGSVLGDILTLEFKINYTRPAVGARLVARAEVVSHGRSQAVCDVRVFVVGEGGEKLCAVAQGTVVPVPRRG